MKNILNRFLLVTLLALPATQVYGQEAVIKENKIENAKIFIEQNKAKALVWIKNKKNQEKLAGSGLLGYSALALYSGSRSLYYNSKYTFNYGFSLPVCLNYIPTNLALLITSLISAGYAIELNPEIIKLSPGFLKNIETKIKESKQNIFKVMKENKKKSMALTISWTLIAMDKFYNYYGWTYNHSINKIALIGSAVLASKLTFDLATNK